MSRKFLCIMVSALAAVTFSGCGGGGGGGSAGTGPGNISQPPSSSWLQFTPSALELTAYEGRPLEFSVTARSSKTIAQAFNVGVVESTGLISTKVDLQKISDLEYQVTLRTADKLAAGTYKSKLEVRLCVDTPTTCAQPIEGSPWSLPISVTVKPATNLTALSEIPALGPWPIVGGNAARANYAPVRLDPSKFSQRWNHNFPGEVRPSEVLYANGIAFVVTDDVVNSYLTAIEESTGRVLWRMGDRWARWSGLSLSGDKVYVVDHSPEAGGHAILAAYDQKTGKSLFSTVLERIDSFNKTLIVNGAIFLHGPIGPSGTSTTTYHVSKLDANTGVLLNRTTMELSHSQSLVADGQYLYALVSTGKLAVMRQSTLEVVSDATESTYCSYGRQNVLGGAGMIVDQCPGRLTAYDTVARRKAWELAGDYNTTVAVAGGTVYVVNAGMLEARALADGKLLWSTALKSATGTVILNGYVLATDNLVFIDGGQSTMAVDTTSHQIVWNFPQGGTMSLSSKGVLYLTQSIPGSGQAGNVVAINLQ